MSKSILAFGLCFLLICSAFIPMSLGLDVKTTYEIEPETITSSSNGPMDSAWPVFQRDVRHIGRSIYGKQGDFGVVKWIKSIGSMVFSSPAIDKNGTIYIGSNDRYFYVINSDGTLKWRYKTDEGIPSSPAIAEDGTIYVGSKDHHLYSFFPNGTKKWRIVIGDGRVESSPVIDHEGIIYAASAVGSNICAVYPDGTKKWDYKTGGWVYCSPALDENGIVYIGSNDGYMYAIYTNNGTLKWKYKTGGKIGSAPTIGDDGIIYFGSNDGYLYALYYDGTLKWGFLAGRDALTSSPAIGEDGTIYVGCHARYIYSISPDGTKNWHYRTDGEVSASPAIDKNGIIYVGSWGGNFYALNPDGTARWKIFTDGEIFSSAAIDENGTIYFGAHFPGFIAKLYAIEPVEGNNPPEKPSIDGPSDGIIRKKYTFYALATDPDGDNVSYFFDWGDGYNSGWSNFFPNGTLYDKVHTWYRMGTFAVKVRAQDPHGADSEWATLKITIPRNRASYDTFWLRFFDMFPLLQRFLFLVK